MADPNSTTTKWRRTVGRRATVVLCFFAAWVVAIEARLVYLQVVRHGHYVARAEAQSERTRTVPARRGAILDRRGRVLAESAEVDVVFAVPAEIRGARETAVALCAALDDCAPGERDRLVEVFATQRRFAYVRRSVSPEQAARVEALELPGVGLERAERRFYPNRELAAHVLGYVGTDNQGLAGIEATYDHHIRGRDGQTLVQVDGSRSQRAFSRVERPPTAGATLELTLDEYLQHFVERELRAAIAENHAESGSVVVMDPATGEILALASEPSFNPNTFRAASASERRNRAVQDLYEPGSTFKVVTASAAFEERVATPHDLIDVSAGAILIGSRRISDVHTYGVLSVTDVLVKSSNVGAIIVGLRLGAERLGRYVRRFGFGGRASPDFPAENPGMVWDAARLTASALASVSMGYQVGVTPLQMAAAVSAIANGGELIEPRVVRAVIRDGVRAAVPRRVVRRAVSPETAATLTRIMEDVVARGTGKAAQVPGYTLAAKTGTAQRLIDGRYSKTEYNASFVGFAPSRDPALAIVVLINSPHGRSGYYGGAVAGPVFKRIAERALRYLGIAPTVGAPAPLVVARQPRESQAVPAASSLPATIVRAFAREDSGAVAEGIVPDLTGLSARDAARTLARAGLTAQVSGDGVVAEQDPPPGTFLDPGVPCRLWLARTPAPPASGAPQ